jgi:nicotinate dehydrogenase subunit A
VTPENVQITVNGQRHTVAAAPATPLLYVLRNELELNSPRFGCGLGRCGAWLVLIDGQAAWSCLVPVGEIGDAAVTTLEGLGTPEAPHSLQDAFIAEQAAQCGYCTPGMIMRAAALLAATPHPDEETIRTALAGNLCRCGVQQRIVRAVRRAAEAQP